MKRLSVMIISAIIIVMSLCISPAAVNMEDGIYEVPVILMHKEDEKESFGNKYVAQVGLLEVVDGKMTVTILLTTDMDGIEFSYYTNGSLEGDTKNGKAVSDVTVAGTVYEQGFEIPVVKSGDIGLKFSVPVMPMSPSARLRIDYSSAKLIESYESETQATITEVSATSPDEVTEITGTEKGTEEETTAEKEDILTEIATENTTETTTAEKEQVCEILEENGEEKAPISYAIALIGIVVVVVLTALKLKRREIRNDDK